MKSWLAFGDDWRRIKSDFKNYIRPHPITKAEEFMLEFDKKMKEKYDSKEETLKRAKLDKVPVTLSANDLNGINDLKKIDEKYQKLQDYLENRETFEREWER